MQMSALHPFVYGTDRNGSAPKLGSIEKITELLSIEKITELLSSKNENVLK